MSKIYEQYTDWYQLLDPRHDHEEEMKGYVEILRGNMVNPPDTLLELGAGAGNNASFLKHHFDCTLVDVSDAMLSESRRVNPECRHLVGDMRNLRLDETFDVVLVHDAVVYMKSESELRSLAETISEHLRPGGAAIVAPDFLAETFSESTQLHEGNEGSRSMRCMDWTWDPDPNDDLIRVEYVFLFRDQNRMEVVHDSHEEGLFPGQRWEDIFREAKFETSRISRPVWSDEEEDNSGNMYSYTDEVFLLKHRE